MSKEINNKSLHVFDCLGRGFTSQSIIFQSCRDGATALPGYLQYFLEGKCILLKDTTRQPK